MLKKFSIFIFFMLTGCMTVGPDYKKPSTNIADHWLQKHSRIKETPPQTTNWWARFNDPTLTLLINRGYQNNLSLQMSGVRVLQSRAQLAQSVGELFPQQQALTANYTHERIGGGSLEGLLPESFNLASMGLLASWELDFWGKYRRAIQTNDAHFLSSLAAYDNSLVTLTADIASTYITIRTIETQIKVTKTNIKVQSESLYIARTRFRAGETSLLDVEQAETELAETEASLPGLVSNLRQQKDRLAVLLGTIPNEMDGLLAKSKGIPRAPRSIAVGIPHEALAQRPDIYQARLDAMAQSAAIGATKANLFPSLTLQGSFTFSSSDIGNSSIGDIFNWSNRTISAGPSLTWPLFNYGQITNAVRVQDAAFQQSLLNYQNVVLKAQQEVQDNITRFIQTQKAEASLLKANKSAIETTRLALIRYQEGETDFTTVLDSERQQLQVQMSLTNSTGDISQAVVSMYRSLGGGWQIRNGNDIVPKPVKDEMQKRTNWGSLLEQKNHEAPVTGWQRFKQLFIPNW